MGFYVTVQPQIGIGFSFNFLAPFIEIVIGPFIVIFGDLNKIDGLDEEDD